MEPVVKFENLDDDEFQNISIEDTQLSEVVLTQDPCLVSSNGLKRKHNEMEEDLTQSETGQPTASVRPLYINDGKSKEISPSNHRIYSLPFFKIVSCTGFCSSTHVIRFYYSIVFPCFS